MLQLTQLLIIQNIACIRHTKQYFVCKPIRFMAGYISQYCIGFYICHCCCSWLWWMWWISGWWICWLGCEGIWCWYWWCHWWWWWLCWWYMWMKINDDSSSWSQRSHLKRGFPSFLGRVDGCVVSNRYHSIFLAIIVPSPIQCNTISRYIPPIPSLRQPLPRSITAIQYGYAQMFHLYLVTFWLHPSLVAMLHINRTTFRNWLLDLLSHSNFDGIFAFDGKQKGHQIHMKHLRIAIYRNQCSIGRYIWPLLHWFAYKIKLDINNTSNIFGFYELLQQLQHIQHMVLLLLLQ